MKPSLVIHNHPQVLILSFLQAGPLGEWQWLAFILYLYSSSQCRVVPHACSLLSAWIKRWGLSNDRTYRYTGVYLAVWLFLSWWLVDGERWHHLGTFMTLQRFLPGLLWFQLCMMHICLWLKLSTPHMHDLLPVRTHVLPNKLLDSQVKITQHLSSGSFTQGVSTTHSLPFKFPR